MLCLITNEKEKVQYNYLANERVDIGKGPNCVISFLHHYLQTYNTANLVLFSDNRVGQNKCINEFSPDRFFGLFKSKYTLSNVDNHQDLMNCVTASSHSGHNNAVSTDDTRCYLVRLEYLYQTIL